MNSHNLSVRPPVFKDIGAILVQKVRIPPVHLNWNRSEFAKAKAEGQAYYQKSGPGGHDKTPGAPPHGTRRTMGKR